MKLKEYLSLFPWSRPLAPRVWPLAPASPPVRAEFLRNAGSKHGVWDAGGPVKSFVFNSPRKPSLLRILPSVHKVQGLCVKYESKVLLFESFKEEKSDVIPLFFCLEKRLLYKKLGIIRSKILKTLFIPIKENLTTLRI